MVTHTNPAIVLFYADLCLKFFLIRYWYRFSQIINPDNKNTCVAAVLLDTDIQSSFMTEIYNHKFGLINRDSNFTIVSGINSTFSITDGCEVNICSISNSYYKYTPSLIVPQIACQLLNVAVSINELNLPRTLPEADPQFCQPSNADWYSIIF